MDTMEIWKEIPGHPGYEAGSTGSIRRIGATRLHPAGHLLKTAVDRHGYLKVCLYANGMPKHYQVHRVVCLAFHGNPPSEKHQAAHGNGVRTDCRAENLRWATAKENAIDRAEHGLWTPEFGEGHHAAILTDRLVVAMRRRHQLGEAMKAIARDLGIAYLTAYDAIKGITWKHVTI